MGRRDVHDAFLWMGVGVARVDGAASSLLSLV